MEKITDPKLKQMIEDGQLDAVNGGADVFFNQKTKCTHCGQENYPSKLLYFDAWAGRWEWECTKCGKPFTVWM